MAPDFELSEISGHPNLVGLAEGASEIGTISGLHSSLIRILKASINCKETRLDPLAVRAVGAHLSCA